MLRFQAFARVLTVVMFIATMSFPQTAVSEAVAKPDPSLEHIRQARKQAASRTRRIIFNNDGNDGRTSPDEPRTHENFLGKRTTALAGSQVDAIFYCTGLFNLYTHHSKESEPRVYREGNVVEWGWELGNKGPDSLETMVRFGHQHGMEVFWSMRMNDCHDSTMPRNLSQWKKDHPECLMGKKGVRFKAGGNRWSALNYAVPETRDKVLRILTDVATRYDVDGLELDFFRSPIYFLPQMHGQPVTREHCDMMTDLLRRVRRMADEQAARRGRPMLIAVRVPDSVEFARAMGLDLVRWLEEDLVDLMAVTCLFRLNPWETSVALGHKHGVPVYASLSESRFKDEEAKALRHTEPCYRGRALEAWAAGMDGIYIFNFDDVQSELWNELGDPEKLLAREHLYTTGYTTVYGANSWLANGTRFLGLPAPLPERPLTLKPGGSASVELRTGPPPPSDPQEGQTSHVRARLRFQKAPEDPTVLQVELNGHALGAGEFSDGWLEYPVKPEWIRKGVNRFDLQLARSQDGRLVLQDLVLAVKPQRIERVEFHSTALGETRHFDIVLPEGFDRDAKEHPFLMFLHGRGRNSRSLLDDPSSRELFLDAGFVTLFPDGDNSWYLDSPANPKAKYASYLNELLALAEIRFGLSKKPERRALAGWSMGGYGCVRFAQAHPGRFGAVASIIGLLDYPRSEEAFPPGQ
ncbi:MAG: family 10 glycosylhydrolase, partial [Pirellulaceae bacterium]|nr:family 10 glycosylhydrolase [Pirellulaceae bacterium]